VPELPALAIDDGLWQTGPVKHRNVLIIGALAVAAVIASIVAFLTPTTRPPAVLPNPNGCDDFAAAAQWLVAWSGDLIAPPEELRSIVRQNSKALETVRSGLKKPSAVPVTNDMTWVNTHIVQLGEHKSMARLLTAEGLIHLQEGRTNEAARSFADCIVFAHAAHRRGLMITELVAIACQAIGAQRLVQVAPHVQPDTLREILPDLIALDQAREPASAILQRDREWSRGAYGVWWSMWMRVLAYKNRRAVEWSFERKHSRSVASLRLVMTELALRGYLAKHGKPPTALAELVPAWLPAVPLDPFSNRPLVYRVTTNSFLLYSVGPDGNDDQGTPLKRGEMETGDLLPNAL
jgi:hypothetical protein